MQEPEPDPINLSSHELIKTNKSPQHDSDLESESLSIDEFEVVHLPPELMAPKASILTRNTSFLELSLDPIFYAVTEKATQLMVPLRSARKEAKLEKQRKELSKSP